MHSPLCWKKELRDLKVYHATAASYQLEVAVDVDVEIEVDFEVDTEVEIIEIRPHLNFIIADCFL